MHDLGSEFRACLVSHELPVERFFIRVALVWLAVVSLIKINEIQKDRDCRILFLCRFRFDGYTVKKSQFVLFMEDVINTLAPSGIFGS